jgi:hypothetical protein
LKASAELGRRPYSESRHREQLSKYHGDFQTPKSSPEHIHSCPSRRSKMPCCCGAPSDTLPGPAARDRGEFALLHGLSPRRGPRVEPGTAWTRSRGVVRLEIYPVGPAAGRLPPQRVQRTSRPPPAARVQRRGRGTTEIVRYSELGRPSEQGRGRGPYTPPSSNGPSASTTCAHVRIVGDPAGATLPELQDLLGSLLARDGATVQPSRAREPPRPRRAPGRRLGLPARGRKSGTRKRRRWSLAPS